MQVQTEQGFMDKLVPGLPVTIPDGRSGVIRCSFRDRGSTTLVVRLEDDALLAIEADYCNLPSVLNGWN
jgi:hypothetical protein